ncbi:hypothetical protein RUND412_011120 [Rhizina undulata]
MTTHARGWCHLHSAGRKACSNIQQQLCPASAPSASIAIFPIGAQPRHIVALVSLLAPARRPSPEGSTSSLTKLFAALGATECYDRDSYTVDSSIKDDGEAQ